VTKSNRKRELTEIPATELAALIARDAQGVVFAGITDRPATDAAYVAGVGATVELSIGATLDTSSTPVRAAATVKNLLPVEDPFLREAVVSIGGINLVLAARRRPFHYIADFTRLGLDPRTARIVVVKSGYLSPELGPIANPSLMALSPGVVDQFVERLERRHKLHPTFPFDDGFEWTPKAVRSARAG
jgi:microcystin degradation protein MlrC